MEQGNVSVRWAGRVLAVRLQDLRRSVLFVGWTDDGRVPLHTLRQLMNLNCSTVTMSWVMAVDGWRLSIAAQDNPFVFRAIWYIAVNELSSVRCFDARLSRGTCFAWLGFHAESMRDMVACIQASIVSLVATRWQCNFRPQSLVQER